MILTYCLLIHSINTLKYGNRAQPNCTVCTPHHCLCTPQCNVRRLIIHSNQIHPRMINASVHMSKKPSGSGFPCNNQTARGDILNLASMPT